MTKNPSAQIHPLTKTFKFLIEQSPMFKFVLRDDGGLSQAIISRHSTPTPLYYTVMSMVANHTPSVPMHGDTCSISGCAPYILAIG